MIFFTGASGVFGTSVLSLPLPAPSLSLLRTSHPRLGPSVRGDLTLPFCGLSSADRGYVQAQTRVIVHAAADTRFDTPLPRAREINVEGTRRVLELAANCPNLELLVHVSTVHVAGLKPGVLPEAPLLAMPEFPNFYEQSKFEAEGLVNEAMSSLPACIVRLTTIAGCEDTGFLERENYLHRLLRLVPSYPLPVLPAQPDALVDLVSVNWTARAFAALLTKAGPGATYHLSAAPANCLTLFEAIDRAFHAFGRRAPRFVTTEATQMLLTRVPNALAGYLFDSLHSVLPHFQVRQEYPNANTMALLDPSLAPPPSAKVFARVLHRIAAAQPERASA